MLLRACETVEAAFGGRWYVGAGIFYDECPVKGLRKLLDGAMFKRNNGSVWMVSEVWYLRCGMAEEEWKTTAWFMGSN